MNLNQDQIHQLGDILCPEIPELEVRQAINARVNQQTTHLREFEAESRFGTKWAEITAKMAAERLGWTLKRVETLLAREGNNVAKTEQNNAAIVLLTGMRERIKPRGLAVAKEEKVRALGKSWVSKAKSFGCNEFEAEKVTQCFAELQLTQSETGKIVNGQVLLDLLTQGIKGNPVNIVELHCIPRVMNRNVGFDITSELRSVNNLADGSLETADQRREVEAFSPIITLFNKFGVKSNLEIMMMDLDTFILEAPDVDNKVRLFSERVKDLLVEMGVDGKITIASERLGLAKAADFLNMPEVKKICRDPAAVVGEKAVEKLVDEMFDKNSKRDLPPELKTRQATRRFAGLRLAIEIMMGKNLPQSNTLFIQRSTTKAACELFLTSAKQVRQSPPFLFFWADRWNKGGDKL